MELKETVGNPNEILGVKPGFEEFFGEIMDIVRKGQINDKLGEELKQLALTFSCKNDLTQFRKVSDTPYERTLIGRDESGWEALIMTWHKGAQSSIHGHPEFAAYNLLKGKLKLEIFEEVDGTGEVELARVVEVDDNTGFYALGKANVMTNHIHRITCLSDISYSLHIYSDDARKGVVYGE
ncbi:cysteine dioxygenase [uncultured Acetobacteroides sp.]|uniref:cysteine dioxygenase n=1 Tax=uncultured Acetobacteroides sp. TaxID=1760811 RepID=UPI0029F57D75|nr:cysteine dioxygenase [uncultured Acetobacteroides sp.]